MQIGTFQIQASDELARAGSFQTAHGSFETPAFMPVGTQGTVKGVTPHALKDLGAQIILSNSYHLHLRPGDELIRDFGGLHKFIGWDGPILTDSGGYQVYSLAKIRRVTNEGVMFQSHLDGSPVLFSPETVVRIQENLGVDIMMVIDECVGFPPEPGAAERACELTARWARESQRLRRREDVLAFGIVQGGFDETLRRQSAAEITSLGFDGYAIGGVSVGESPELLHHFSKFTAPLLPESQIRYLMGVGYPHDIVRAVGYGIDLFDCVMPTRSARFGRMFCRSGYFNIRNKEFRTDSSALDPECSCYTCQHFSRAYLSHLLRAKEALFVQLASIHNLHFYQALMRDIRQMIRNKSFGQFREQFLSEFQAENLEGADEADRD